MIAVIARLTAKQGQDAELEALLRALSEKVRSQEPGCKLYQLSKSRTPNEFVVIERYEDQAALDAHSKTPYFATAFRDMEPLLAGNPTIELLSEL